MSPRELLIAAAAAANKHEDTLRLMLGHADWHPERLAAEFALEGWQGRLQEALVTKYADYKVGGIGPRSVASLTDAECRKLISPKMARAVDDYDGGPALLLGKTGIGKTIAARLMARKVGRAWATNSIQKHMHKLESLDVYCRADEHPGIAWLAASDLALAVMRHPLGQSAPAEMKEARGASLLVLDDLTWAQRDDATLEALGYRYHAGLPTIATAGCTRTELVARFGGAVVRRMLECGGKKSLVAEEF